MSASLGDPPISQATSPCLSRGRVALRWAGPMPHCGRQRVPVWPLWQDRGGSCMGGTCVPHPLVEQEALPGPGSWESSRLHLQVEDQETFEL